MQTGFGQICINPTQPTEAAGFIQQRNVKLTDVHDDLYARILGVRDDSTTLFLVSLDNLGTPYRLEEELTRQYAQETGEQAVVQISCTHDHFAANVEDEDYYRLLKERILIGCKELVWHMSDLRLSRRHIYFDAVGHSRITGHKAKNIFTMATFRSARRLFITVIRRSFPALHRISAASIPAMYCAVYKNGIRRSFSLFSKARPATSARVLHGRGKIMKVSLRLAISW